MPTHTIADVVAGAAERAFCHHQGALITETFRANLEAAHVIAYAYEPTPEAAFDGRLEAAFAWSAELDPTDDYEGDAAKRLIVDGKMLVAVAHKFGIGFAAVYP